ncbi:MULTISPECIES: sulfur carrier protein ThiS [Actinomycetes]|jgi:sulfur carrier protein|uniref:sulfur carrier protein ThiS n=1 Tax=Actinomycetes TaxID=1760 RepID=UPI0004C1E25E|nr:MULTISPECIES: sulfur carrier protein ThiS [Actinomycetes]
MATDVNVNGDDVRLPDGATVLTLLDQLDLPRTGVAVAVDGVVHPQSRWGQELGPCERIEILTAVQGG